MPSEILRRPVFSRPLLALAATLLLGMSQPDPVEANGDDSAKIAVTTALAEDFLRAFAARNFERVEELLAPDARIQWAWLGDQDSELESFSVEEWLARVTESTAGLDDFQVEILESNALAFDDGVSVSVRFRMLGSVGGGRFVNDGVDTLSFAQIDGQWRIVLSSSIEKLVFVRPTGSTTNP